jgi:gliding motility-associated-like protein
MNMRKLFLLLGIILPLSSIGQKSTEPAWAAHYSKSKTFIENMGQFDDQENSSTGKIRYAIDFGSTRIFFGDKGVSYSFLEAVKIPKEQRDELRTKMSQYPSERKTYEKLVGKFLYKTDLVNMVWGNSSPAVQLIGQEETTDYHNYSYNNGSGEIVGASGAKGFKKLVYQQLYPGIDVEYVVHPEIGVKYALIVHPGADPSLVKMVYDREISLLDGKIQIPTQFGNIIDHEPYSYYENNRDYVINSHFKQEQRSISFEVTSYDPTKTLIIDPWTQTPAFNTNWDVVWECERDGSGNVYILGGIMPMQVLKYSNAGALLWTYSTPYDTSNCWLGTLATDLAGNSYVTRGSISGIQKISAAGALIWNNNGGGGSIGNSDEYWSIEFNCDQSGLVVGGTTGAFALPPVLEAAIFNINSANGNISNTSEVAIGPTFSIPPNLQEVRSIAGSPNGKYYFLTQDTIGFISDNFGLCSGNSADLFKIDNGMNLGYKSENYRYDNTGICALAADGNALYVNRGNQLQKRSLSSLSIISNVTIPNGGFISQGLGNNGLTNSGIAIDNCGNIYVGSTDGVYKFNNSLVQQAFYPTAFKVFDVEINSGGEIIACGGTGDSNSGSRTGGIQSFAASACTPIALNCCDATICIPQTFCINDSPVTLTVATAGGTWSGNGVNSSGIFNPASAGVGSHTITYTLPCGSESITVVVSSCQSIQVCIESNGSLTVTGGAGPYTWSQLIPANTSSITNQTQCEACGYVWNAGFPPFFPAQCLNALLQPVTSCVTPAYYSNFGTGITVTPPGGVNLLQVTDATNTTLQFDVTSLLPCNSIPCPTINVNTTSLNNVACFGQTTGSAVVSASGGSGNYTYNWTPGNLSGASQNTLGAGTYTVNVVDGNNCPGSTSVTITQPSSALSVTASSTNTNCGASTGTATATVSGGTTTYSYSWSPTGGSGATASGLAANTYTVTVTDQNGCQASANTTVNTNGGPLISVSSQNDVSCNGSNDGSATVNGSGGSGALTYTWTPGNLIGATQNTLAAGVYTIQVSDAGGCTNSTTLTINEPSAIVIAQGTIVPATCGASDGSATVNVSGGAGGFSFVWSPNVSSTATATNISSGNYTVDVEDQNGCAASLTFVLTNVGGPTVSISSSTDVSCFGGNDGTATASATGGSTPYSYIWTPSGGNNPLATGLSAGIYTVTVTDNTSCVGSTTVTIGEPSAITILETIVPANCGSANGSISIVVSGGTGTYTTSWTPGGSTATSITGLTPGNYSVTVTDQQGCSSTENYVVPQTGSLSVDATPELSTINVGESVQFSTIGGTTYSWSPSASLDCSDCPDPVATPSTSTMYIVTGTDASGCTGTDTVYVTVIPEPIECGDIFVPTVLSPNGTGGAANKMICVYGGCVTEISFAIYNRWGEKVFETNDVNLTECWDGTYKGKEMNAGTFAYKLIVTLTNNDIIEESGNITLVR